MGLFNRLKQERDRCDRCHEPFGVLAGSHVVVLGTESKLVCDDCLEHELADRTEDVDEDTNDDVDDDD